jgi:5'-3' exonuclease
MGFFYRTIRIVENGIKPAYVFDGKPPELKSGVVSAISDFSPIDTQYFQFITSSWPNGLNDERKLERKEKRQRKQVNPDSFRRCMVGNS